MFSKKSYSAMAKKLSLPALLKRVQRIGSELDQLEDSEDSSALLEAEIKVNILREEILIILYCKGVIEDWHEGLTLKEKHSQKFQDLLKSLKVPDTNLWPLGLGNWC